MEGIHNRLNNHMKQPRIEEIIKETEQTSLWEAGQK
jgi:hypothetical protein